MRIRMQNAKCTMLNAKCKVRIVHSALCIVHWSLLIGFQALAAQQHSYLPAEVEAGGRLYQANCTGCHGPEGDGIAAVNFSKAQFRRAASDDDLVRVIISGIPGTPMPPSTFSEGQAGTIVAYLRGMGGEGTAA